MTESYTKLPSSISREMDHATVAVYARLRSWAIFGKAGFVKKWGGRMVQLACGQGIYALSALAKSLGYTIGQVRGAVKRLVAMGEIMTSTLGRGRWAQGTLYTVTEMAGELTHVLTHGEISESPEPQWLQDAPLAVEHTVEHGLVEGKREEGILNPPPNPPADLGVDPETSSCPTPLVLEPTPEELNLIRRGESAIDSKASERVRQKFIREYRASSHVISAEDAQLAFAEIKAHPYLAVTTKAITRIFHMKQVRAAAREFDTREHASIHECCSRTGDIEKAKARYRALWRDKAFADALIFHYHEEFEAHRPVEAYGS